MEAEGRECTIHRRAWMERGAFRFASCTLRGGVWGNVVPEYRRLFVPGGEFFFTVNLEDRSGDLLTRNIRHVRTAWRHVEERMPFETVATVVLPDHIHCIWRLPPDDPDFSGRWRMFKARFTRSLAEEDKELSGRRARENHVSRQQGQ